MTDRQIDETLPPTSPPQTPCNCALHSEITSAQQANGLKFNDYKSYHAYVTRKLKRLRKKGEATNRSDERNGRSRKYKKNIIAPTTHTISPTHLEIVLFDSERAWAHAMEVKEDTLSSKSSAGGRRQMFLARLKKATKCALALEKMTQAPNVATDKTSLEATAYRGNLLGTLAMEKEQWEEAHKQFSLAHTLLNNLAKLPGANRGEIEIFSNRARDIEPSIRYCKYNMEDPAAHAELDHASMLGNASYLKLQALLESATDEGGSIELSQDDGAGTVPFRNSHITLSPPSVRLSFLRVQETLKDFKEKGAVEGEEGERLYVKALTAVDDLLIGVGREVERLNNMNHTPTVENKIANLELLRHYAKFLKLKCSCDRGEQVVSHLQSHSSTSPSEFVHIYDSLLQNAKEIVTVGGGDPDDDFSLSASALVLRVRANRCRYLGMFYENSVQYQKAIAILAHAQNLATDAAEQYQALDDGSSEVKEMTDLEEKVTGDKCRATAKLYLSSVGKATGAVSKNLIQRLSKFDSAIDPSTGKVTVSSVPLLTSVYAKPTFFDIANNFVEMPKLEEEEGEGHEEDENEDDGEAAEGGGGFLGGWFSR